MYIYETHLHTSPVSKCAIASVRQNLSFYKSMGYDGVFITNHFLDGNINIDSSLPYEDRINFYFSDYEEGVIIGKELGIKVFCGVEMSYRGTDFLVYGLDKEWYLANPQIMNMRKTEELEFLMDNGALIIQAHPFREAFYIDHIRLLPRSVHGVEVINACNTELANRMARLYADNYGLIEFAGSDNHCAEGLKKLSGMSSNTPIDNVCDFVSSVKNRRMSTFTIIRD